MKRFFLTFVFGLAGLFADEPSHSLWDYHPLHLGGNTIYIGSADVHVRKEGDEGSVRFNKSNAFLFMLLPVSETSYFFPRVEWNTFQLDWNKNPRFNETRFNYVQFGLTFYTTSLDKWRWIARVDYNIDAKHFSQPGPYGLGSGILWGAYQIHPKWHYHVGSTAYVGMEGATVYPIIGADYSPNDTWTFKLIFPIDYSIQYQPVDWCRLAVKGRPLRERFRVGSDEPDPKAVFNYSSMGLELNAYMEKKMRFEFEIFGGYNFGGTLYIKDQHGKNSLYTDMGGALYVGANVDYAF